MSRSIGVHCIRGNIKHDDCKRCAKDPLHPCGYPADLLELMVRDTSQPPTSAHSPSRILGCDRQLNIENFVDYFVDVDYAYPMTRGSMFHALMETTTYPDAYFVAREQRLTLPVETTLGIKDFTGKPDLVVAMNPPVDGVLHVKIVDYKSKAEIGHDLVEAVVDHQIQINLYAYLVTQCLKVEGATSIVVDELEIVYCDMKKVRRFTTAGPLVARGKRIGRTGSNYDTLDLAPLRMKSIGWSAKLIKHRIEQRENAKSTLPEVLPIEDSWKCVRCPVLTACDALAVQDNKRRPMQ